MAEQETSYPVIATLTSENGVFLVCEPKGSTSEVSSKRDELEKKLSAHILRSLCETESSIPDQEPVVQTEELVAVSVTHLKHWQRGIIKKKFGNFCEVLLVDWGTTVNLLEKDIQPLPPKFKAMPNFSCEAILEGVRPLTNVIDYSSPNGPVLKKSFVTEFDAGALSYIEDMLNGSSETRMSVKGKNGRYLIIRLFLKQKGSSSFCCLNDELCKEEYAENISKLSAASFDAQKKSPQELHDPEKLNLPLVAFSDYAKNYTKVRNELEKQAITTTLTCSETRDSLPYVGKMSALASPRQSVRSPEEPRGRGKLLAKNFGTEHEAHLSGSGSISGDTRGFSPGRRISRPSTDLNMSIEQNLTSDEIKTYPMYSNCTTTASLNQLSSRQQEQRLQSEKLNTTGDSLDSDFSGRTSSMSIGRGRELFEAYSSQFNKRVQAKGAALERPSMSVVENTKTRNQACIEQLSNQFNSSGWKAQTNTSAFNVAVPQASQAKTPTADLPSMFPAGMPVNPTLQQPQKPQRTAPFNRAQPMFAPPRSVIRPPNAAFDLRSASRAVAPEKHPQTVEHTRIKTVTTPRSEALKSSILRFQSPINRHSVPQQSPEKQMPPASRHLEEKLASRVITSKPVAQTANTPIDSGIDEEVLRNTMELFELVPGKPSGISQTKQGPQLKLSQYVELLKEGRVLVRCPGDFTPTCDLNDIPFETPILEALGRVGIRQPKIIQSYVWNTLLSLANVAFVAGSKAGKTLGYLVPVLNNLLDESVYQSVPKGCSPLAIVVCPTWKSAEAVHTYCCNLTSKLSVIRSCYLSDRSPESIKMAIPLLINGVALLAVTAPALRALLEESQDVISFDRCCHLVFEDADILLKSHMDTIRDIFIRYEASVQRTRNNAATCHMTRQVIICASEWSRPLRSFINQALENPWQFISSCVEAAVYGQMMLHLFRGTKDEMKAVLFKTIVEKKQLKQKVIIFCRDSEEIHEVGNLLRALSIEPLIAHGQSVLSDLSHVTRQWETASHGNAVLLCTDDVLTRLDIRNAEVLIHYFIPSQSKYNFTYRLSFAMDNFRPEVEDMPRPESYLLLTEEFNNSLMGIVRLMGRFGYPIPEDLWTEAVMSYCDKQTDRKDFPLCSNVKAFGECHNVFHCDKRHLMRKGWDHSHLPFKNGMVRLKITAVHTATQYYARILKWAGEDRKMIDVTGPGLKLEADIRKHFCGGGVPVNSVQASTLAVGDIFARKMMEGLYQRVRVEKIREKDTMGVPLVVDVFSLDLGDISSCRINDLFWIPEELKLFPPQAIEIFLVGLRPLDKDHSWHCRSTDFVRERINGHELDGRVVLALSSTLWLSPLHERKKVNGTNAMVVVTDIFKELLDTHRAEKNEEHLQKLYNTCKIGQISLSDYSIGIAPKRLVDEPEVRYAFLPLSQDVKVKVARFLNPEKFYVTTVDYQRLVYELESDISKEIGKCNTLAPEEAVPGKLCLVGSLDRTGFWSRSCIKRQTSNEGQYEVFYVDYGITKTVELEHLKALPKKFAERLPFQAISCSLKDVKPIDDVWTDEAVEFINALLNSAVESPLSILVKAEEKSRDIDSATKSAIYLVKLTVVDGNEAPAQDLNTMLVTNNHAISIAEEKPDSVLLKVSESTNDQTIEMCPTEVTQSSHSDEREIEEDGADPFFVHPSWLEEFLPAQKRHSSDECKKKNDDDKVDEAIKQEPNQEQDDEELLFNDRTLPLEAANIDTDVRPSRSESDASEEGREQTDTKSTLIAPQKSPDSSFPTSKWYQTKEQVNITFEIGEVDSYEVECSPNSIIFTAVVNLQRYELKTNTYGAILPERSTHKKTSAGVVLKLQKRNIAEEWIRLIQSPHRPDWLRRDFTHISEFLSDCEEEDEKLPIVDPKYAFEVDQDSTDSSSSEYELPDEREFGDYF